MTVENNTSKYIITGTFDLGEKSAMLAAADILNFKYTITQQEGRYPAARRIPKFPERNFSVKITLNQSVDFAKYWQKVDELKEDKSKKNS